MNTYNDKEAKLQYAIGSLNKMMKYCKNEPL